jgi:hypothetical protein
LRPLQTILLASLCAALLGAANYYLWSSPLETSPLALSAAPQTVLADAGGARPQEILPNTLLVHGKTRPLFSPSRRQWVAPEPPQAEPAVIAPQAEAAPPPELPAVQAEPPKIKLLGIQQTPAGAQALLLREGAAEAVWRKSAEKIEAWTIQSIDPGSVELTLGSAKLKIELYPNLQAAEPPHGQ